MWRAYNCIHLLKNSKYIRIKIYIVESKFVKLYLHMNQTKYMSILKDTVELTKAQSSNWMQRPLFDGLKPIATTI